MSYFFIQRIDINRLRKLLNTIILLNSYFRYGREKANYI